MTRLSPRLALGLRHWITLSLVVTLGALLNNELQARIWNDTSALVGAGSPEDILLFVAFCFLAALIYAASVPVMSLFTAKRLRLGIVLAYGLPWLAYWLFITVPIVLRTGSFVNGEGNARIHLALLIGDLVLAVLLASRPPKAPKAP